jgi:hypothetical protein
VVRAKRYAKRSGMSISQMVEAYLDTVTASDAPARESSFAESFRGILKNGDREAYRAHLVKKYL